MVRAVNARVSSIVDLAGGRLKVSRQPCLASRSPFAKAGRLGFDSRLPNSYFPIGCGSDRTIKISQSVP